MRKTITYFEQRGKANTEQVLALVKERAAELGIRDVVVPTVGGTVALQACEHLAGLHLVVVTHSFGFAEPGRQQVPAEVLAEIRSRGADIFTGTHALGGIGRAVRRKFGTYQVDEIIAHTLRLFGEGVKVAIEIAMAAADAGLISPQREVISCGGTGHGLDAALVLRPAHVQDFFDLEVLEIICKPRSPR